MQERIRGRGTGIVKAIEERQPVGSSPASHPPAALPPAPCQPTHLLLQAAQLLPLQRQPHARRLQLALRRVHRRPPPLQLSPQVAAGGGPTLRLVLGSTQRVGHQVQRILCICCCCLAGVEGVIVCLDLALPRSDTLLDGGACGAGGQGRGRGQTTEAL